jgi:endonuclease/exonuclease/phosphatase family metal-dependent hydrolase
MPRWWLALPLAILAACATTPPPPTTLPAALRVMSFNVRLPVDSDGPDRWQARRELAADVVARAAPDLVGTQELHKVQGDWLVERLPRYAWFGRDRRGGHDDEHMGVFYRRDRLRVVDSGDFWLSATPDIPGSISWGHPFPRMATWALFERIADGRRFYLFNTHLPYRDEDDAAREHGARLLAERIAALPADVPVVVTGDFNATPESAVHATLTGTLDDAWNSAASRTGPDATFHAFSGKADRRIDWILVRGFEVREASTLEACEGNDGRCPSDHFPVLAELRWR